MARRDPGRGGRAFTARCWVSAASRPLCPPTPHTMRLCGPIRVLARLPSLLSQCHVARPLLAFRTPTEGVLRRIQGRQARPTLAASCEQGARTPCWGWDIAFSCPEGTLRAPGPSDAESRGEGRPHGTSRGAGTGSAGRGCCLTRIAFHGSGKGHNTSSLHRGRPARPTPRVGLPPALARPPEARQPRPGREPSPPETTTRCCEARHQRSRNVVLPSDAQ